MATSRAVMLVMEAALQTNQDRAARLCSEALEADADCQLAHYHLGLIYSARGLYERAIHHYRQILDRLNESDPGIWFLLARQYHLTGQIDAAIPSYRKALALDPACEKACLYLAQIFLRTGGDPKEALNLAHQALALRPRTSMVDEAEFVSTLERAEAVNTGGTITESSSHISALRSDLYELASMSVARVLELDPSVERIFEHHGIRCVGCAGSEDLTVRQASADYQVDLEALVLDLRRQIGSTLSSR